MIGVFGNDKTCWRQDRLAGGLGFPYGLSHKNPPEGETQMAYSLYDAAVTPCAQQLGALAGIIDKAAAHCAPTRLRNRPCYRTGCTPTCSASLAKSVSRRISP